MSYSEHQQVECYKIPQFTQSGRVRDSDSVFIAEEEVNYCLWAANWQGLYQPCPARLSLASSFQNCFRFIVTSLVMAHIFLTLGTTTTCFKEEFATPEFLHNHIGLLTKYTKKIDIVLTLAIA